MENIKWTGQNKLFGLDYSTKIGSFHDYIFDIRYDYDGLEENINPECGLVLHISKEGKIFKSILANNINQLIRYSENYLKQEKLKFI